MRLRIPFDCNKFFVSFFHGLYQSVYYRLGVVKTDGLKVMGKIMEYLIASHLPCLPYFIGQIPPAFFRYFLVERPVS